MLSKPVFHFLSLSDSCLSVLSCFFFLLTLFIAGGDQLWAFMVFLLPLFSSRISLPRAGDSCSWDCYGVHTHCMAEDAIGSQSSSTATAVVANGHHQAQHPLQSCPLRMATAFKGCDIHPFSGEALPTGVCCHPSLISSLLCVWAYVYIKTPLKLISPLLPKANQRWWHDPGVNAINVSANAIFTSFAIHAIELDGREISYF